MKYIVQQLTKCSGRIGILSEIERKPGTKFETPLLMLYTKGASIPHITAEVFELLMNERQILSIGFANTYHFTEALKEFGKGITEFSANNECLSYVTVQDSGEITLQGHNERDFVPLWTKGGKKLINAESYMNAIETFKPDIYQTLCDADNAPDSSNKRLLKSVCRTDTMFNLCMEKHKKSSALMKSSAVLGVITGGYNLQHRDNSVKNLLESEYFPLITGIVIDGLQASGPNNTNSDRSALLDVVDHVLAKVPSDLLRTVNGCFSPKAILNLVSKGIDLFDSSYVYTITEKNIALVFGFQMNMKTDSFGMLMSDEQYKEDFGPILEGCDCLTCRKHTRAYIFHLINTKELLAPVLLSIHNLHHYVKFFKTIRDAVRNEKLEELKEVVEKQYEQFQEICKPSTEENTIKV